MGPSQDGRVASPGSSQEHSSLALGMAGSLLKITHYTSKGEDRLVSVVNRIMASRNSLQFCVEVLARMTSAVDQSNRAMIAEDVSLDRLKIAHRVIDIVSATEVTEHIGKLTTLDPFLKDSVWVTQGRMRKGLPQIFGVFSLQLLLPHQRLAELIMIV